MWSLDGNTLQSNDKHRYWINEDVPRLPRKPYCRRSRFARLWSPFKLQTPRCTKHQARNTWKHERYALSHDLNHHMPTMGKRRSLVDPHDSRATMRGRNWAQGAQCRALVIRLGTCGLCAAHAASSWNKFPSCPIMPSFRRETPKCIKTKLFFFPTASGGTGASGDTPAWPV